MKIKRQGTNKVSCELYESEISYLGIDLNKIKESIDKKQELEKISDFVINILKQHMNPLIFINGCRVDGKILVKKDSVLVEFEIPGIPFEAIDLPNDFDYDFNIDEYIEEDKELNEDDTIVSIVFKNMDDVIKYVKQLTGIKKYPHSSLYLYENEYYLNCNFIGIEREIEIMYDYVSTDIRKNVILDIPRILHVEEHGKQLINENVFKKLGNVLLYEGEY